MSEGEGVPFFKTIQIFTVQKLRCIFWNYERVIVLDVKTRMAQYDFSVHLM